MSDNDDLTLEELALRDKLLSVWQDTLVYQQLPFWPTENMSPLAVDMESLPWLPAPDELERWPQLSDDQAREVQRALEEAVARRRMENATGWVAEVEALWQAQLEEWRCDAQKRGE